MEQDDLSLIGRAEIEGSEWDIRRPSPPSQAMKRRLTEDVLHAIKAVSALHDLALRFGRFELRQFEPGSVDYWRSEALVSSFLLHVRGLDELLYPDHIAVLAGRTDGGVIDLGWSDLTAFDLVRQPQAWIDERPERSLELVEARRRINRSLMHFDVRRARDFGENVGNVKEQSWRVGDFYGSLKPTLSAFVAMADDSVLCEGFRYFAREALDGNAVYQADAEDVGE